VPEGALPTYLLDREGQKVSRRVSNEFGELGGEVWRLGGLEPGRRTW